VKPPGTLKRTSRRESLAERAARDAFNDIILFGFEGELQPCLFSTTRPDHVCDGPLDAHHLIEEQFLRGHPPFAALPEDELLAVIYDARNGAPLCRNGTNGSHTAVTTHADYVYLDELPLAATDFAADHNIVFRLERECPARRPR
jgi:hypothetical protein